MSNTASTITILAGIAGLLALQTFWIIRALNSLERRIDRIDERLDRIEGALREHGERLARLEQRAEPREQQPT